jgi:hypothetical protein
LPRDVVLRLRRIARHAEIGPVRRVDAGSKDDGRRLEGSFVLPSLHTDRGEVQGRGHPQFERRNDRRERRTVVDVLLVAPLKPVRVVAELARDTRVDLEIAGLNAAALGIAPILQPRRRIRLGGVLRLRDRRRP